MSAAHQEPAAPAASQDEKNSAQTNLLLHLHAKGRALYWPKSQLGEKAGQKYCPLMSLTHQVWALVRGSSRSLRKMLPHFPKLNETTPST